MRHCTVINADVREALRGIPDGTVQTCVTSPPYYALRDYGVDGQIGLEETPVAYVEELVRVFREVRRILRDDGTLWLNLGDSYATRAGRNTAHEGLHGGEGKRNAATRGLLNTRVGGLKPKDLIGIPWRVALALQADGWWLRSDIVWAKPNPMPESVDDRCTRAHEFVFMLSKSERYYFNADAIKERVTGNAHSRGSGVNPKAAGPGKNETSGRRTAAGFNERWRVKQNESFSSAISGDLVEFRNKRDVWTIPSEPFPEAHFAVMPTALVEPCILAGSPPGARVLDIFGGSGTVGVVAARTGRDSILVELNPSYARMSARRVRDDAPLFNVTEVVQSWPGSEKTDVGAMDSSATQTEHSSPARSGELTTESGGST